MINIVLSIKSNYKIKITRSDWKIMGYFYICFIFVLIVDRAEDNTPIRVLCLHFALQSVLTIIIVLLMVYWIIPKFIIEEKKLFLFSLSTLSIMAVFGMLDRTIEWYILNKDWDGFPSPLKLFFYNIFALADSVGLLLGVFLYRNLFDTLLKNSEIEKARKENELKLLRSQLNPHFLFNNLTSLNYLIEPTNVLAKEYTNKLSKIYRYLIKTKDQDISNLEKEIDFAKNYIFLIKTRFEKSFQFSFKNKATDLDTKFIPTGALQSLLENVVKHNRTTLKLTVEIIITITNDTVTVYNTKTKLKSETTSFGTGLKNLQKRYDNLSLEKIIIDDTSDYFSINIPIVKTFKR